MAPSLTALCLDWGVMLMQCMCSEGLGQGCWGLVLWVNCLAHQRLPWLCKLQMHHPGTVPGRREAQA